MILLISVHIIKEKMYLTSYKKYVKNYQNLSRSFFALNTIDWNNHYSDITTFLLTFCKNFLILMHFWKVVHYT